MKSTTTRFLLTSILISMLFNFAWGQTPVNAPDVHVGDFWKYRSTDGFTNETQIEYSHRVVELSDAEITIQLQNNKAPSRELRFYNHQWNALDIGKSKYKPYYPEYKFPMSIGDTWAQEIK